MRFNRPLSLLCASVFVVVLCVALALQGCGKKAWPEPKAQGERFEFKESSATFKDGCLVIRSKIKGKSANLGRLVLELAEIDVAEDCPGCPFHPTQQVEIELKAPNVKLRERSLVLKHCKLTPGQSFRWRLVGYNSYPGLAVVTSRVGLATPCRAARAPGASSGR